MRRIKYFNNYNNISEQVYGHSITKDNLINKEWDDLYEIAKKDPYKSKIKKNLVRILKDREAFMRICDRFYYSEGSNGFISFDNISHFITDIGFMTFADNVELIDDVEAMKKHILYNYASSDVNPNLIDRFKNRKYDPNEEFTW